MAFFDKLNQFTKNLGDMANDTFETGKLNNTIKAENQAAGEELKKIGKFYYDQFVVTGEAAPEILEFCQSAKSHYDAAAGAQAEIDKMKAENEAAARAANQTAAVPLQALPGGITCQECGTANAEGTKFCCNCGTKLEIPVPKEPESLVCSSCGAANNPGTKFCCECGTKLEIPAPAEPEKKICPNCGTEAAPGVKFCNECGTRLG